MTRQLPLVVVLGATACGKSKLAIELATRFQGEIISADSMQVYKGLNIVTNKVTVEEQAQIKHHMIDLIDPSKRFSIVDFRNQSLSIIQDCLQSGKLPVIVGGTHYYIESLLWKNFLIDANREDSTTTMLDAEAQLLQNLPDTAIHSEEDLCDKEKFFQKPIYHDSCRDLPSEKLWDILKKVDTRSADMYHPHDKRRIIRCLQIIQNRKRNYSDILDDLNKSIEEGRSSLGGPLRYQPTCVFWLSCDSEELDKIIDERVNQMLDRGLLEELEKFHGLCNERMILNWEKPNYSRGIFQTIGFKEFHSFLVLNKDKRDTEEGQKILNECICNMKISTRRYARRQLKWIRRRFLQQGTRDLPPVYKLDTKFNPTAWDEQVKEPAFKIIEHLMHDRAQDVDSVLLKQVGL